MRRPVKTAKSKLRRRRLAKRARVLTSRRARPLSAALAGAAGAVAAALLLDPASGRRRRAVLRDRMAAGLRRVRRRGRTKAEFERGRLEGLTHRLAHDDEPPDADTTLADKVQSEVLGQQRYSGIVVNVDAHDGVVSLRGEVADPEIVRSLPDDVRRVPGVREVVSYLHPPGQAAPNTREVRDVS